MYISSISPIYPLLPLLYILYVSIFLFSLSNLLCYESYVSSLFLLYPPLPLMPIEVDQNFVPVDVAAFLVFLICGWAAAPLVNSFLLSSFHRCSCGHGSLKPILG